MNNWIHNDLFMAGICGTGMAPLALLLAQSGCKVTGWDDAPQPHVQQLLANTGIQFSDTFSSNNQALIRSSAIATDHPLCQLASDAARPIYRRGECLAHLAQDYKLIAICGSHGKTTTTAMLIHMLDRAGFDFSYVLGGFFQGDKLPARHSPNSPWLIAEIDESDGTIDDFSAELAVIVNLDWDHADQYASEQAVVDTIASLMQRSASVIAPETLRLTLNQNASGNTHFVASTRNDFNDCNRALAAAVCRQLNIDLPVDALADFTGVRRRQECLLEQGSLRIFTDYAHHPTEIAALLQHTRKQREGRLHAVYQPHRYTRTLLFAGDFARALSAADEVTLLPVYAAGETPLAGGDSNAIAKAGGFLLLEPQLALNQLSQSVLCATNDTNATELLFVGAGDIDEHAREFSFCITKLIQWQESLSEQTILRLYESLAAKTTMRLGGSARFYAEPGDAQELATLLQISQREQLPRFILGRGSNLLISDEGFDGLVIALRGDFWREIKKLGDSKLRVRAGVRLKELCGFAAAHGLGGLEFLEGIPGSLGGALRMNAGAMGGWMFDVVESVTFAKPDGTLHTLAHSDFEVGYRHCAQLEDAVAVEATLRVLPANGHDIRGTMNDFATQRKASQPREPSAGCIFRNPEGGHAGKIIDELGLKGTSVGGAAVSDMHANFIINRGNATCTDVIQLVRHIRAKVRQERGIDLEPEALLIGKRWEDVL